MNRRTRSRAHTAQRHRSSDPSPVEWRGLVIAAPGAIDIDAIDGAAIITQRDAKSIAADLREGAAQSAKVALKLTAQLETRRADVDDAGRARQQALTERSSAASRFESFEHDLRVVVDATYALVAANTDAAQAGARLDSANERLAELSAHRRALEGVIDETECRAEFAARLSSGAEVTSLNAVVLDRGMDVAKRARLAAESARDAWATLGEELDGLQTAADESARRLQGVVDRLHNDLVGGETPEEAAVRNALREYDLATSAPVDRLAVALADRWAQAHEQLAELDLAEPQPSAEQVAAAKERLDAAEVALQRAVEAAQSGKMSSAERQAIEDAHAVVVSGKKGLGRASRQHRTRAEDELHRLLAAHGLGSWLDYLTAGLSVDPLHQEAVAGAEREVVEARAALAELELAVGPSPQRLTLVGMIDEIRCGAIDVLGFWPDGDLPRHLRAQPLVDPASSSALFIALMDAGVPIGDQPIAAAARGWLEQVDAGRQARSELEAALARATGRLDGLAALSAVTGPDALTKLVTDATAVAAARADHCVRTESLLQASLDALRARQADDGTVAWLERRDQAVRWALATVVDGARDAHDQAAEEAERAATAVVGAEEALAHAWRDLRQLSTDPLPDLAAAVQRMERLLEESGAAAEALGVAEDRYHRAEAALAVAEAALARHGGVPDTALREPTPEEVSRHLEQLLRPEHTALVLDEPFPGLAPAMFDRVLRTLAGLAADRLVVYLTDDAGLGQGARLSAVGGPSLSPSSSEGGAP